VKSGCLEHTVIPPMRGQKPKPRSAPFSILDSAGAFLIGAALPALFLPGHETALSGSGMLRSPVKLDQAAPQLALIDLQGNLVSLQTYRGTVLLVKIWTTI
jgi:hypothetical protein